MDSTQIQNGSTVAFATLLVTWLYKHGSRTGKELAAKDSRIAELYRLHLASSVDVAVARKDTEQAQSDLIKSESLAQERLDAINELKKELYQERDSLRRAQERIITTDTELEAMSLLLRAAEEEIESLRAQMKKHGDKHEPNT